MKNIEIKKVQVEDAGFIHQLINNKFILDKLNEIETTLDVWVDAINIWESDLDEENYLIYINSKPIGWIGINGLVSETKHPFIKIITLLPKYHNQGIGKYVIKKILNNLKLREYKFVSLYTDCSNKLAQSCYKSCGFEVIKKTRQRMGNGLVIERYKMELVL
jgi:ribosomal protein S18 acetylase RimI-like enzyme